MSITNPFNFGPRIGSIDTPANKPEVSGRIIAIRRSRWKYKYGIGSSNPLDPAVREDYIEYIDVGEPDAPWDPIGGGGGSGSSGGGGGRNSSGGGGGGTVNFPIDCPTPIEIIGNGVTAETRKIILDRICDLFKKYTACFNSLFPSLMDCMKQALKKTSIAIDQQADFLGSSSKEAPWTLTINPKIGEFGDYSITALIAHELLHLCSSIDKKYNFTEMDIEIIMYKCFPLALPETPGPVDWRTEFQDDINIGNARRVKDTRTGHTLYVTRYFIIDESTGKVYRNMWGLNWAPDPLSSFQLGMVLLFQNNRFIKV